jgi:glucans biosynthesis protein
MRTRRSAIWPQAFAALCLVLAPEASGEPSRPADARLGASGASEEVVTSWPRPAVESIFDSVARQAQLLAAAPYAPTAQVLPASFSSLDYDGFRKVRPDPPTAAWRQPGEAFAVLPLPRGFLYRDPVAVHLVENGQVRRIDDVSPYVDFRHYPEAPVADRAGLGVSGLRILSAFGGAEPAPEAAVFQGASYFRAVATNLAYGLSARALAVDAFTTEGEEFPRFTDFWVVKPDAGADSITLVALIDSPSLAAAYEFRVHPGDETVMDIRASIHPRREIREIGLAPMSSMFLQGAADRGRVDDFRQELHDSDGLSIEMANGESIWRPVTNPTHLQVSSFRADSVRGFGLLQRERDFKAYNDFEARYHKRPSLWVQPRGDWGRGDVVLAEIPTTNEYADNIAVLWRPAEPAQAGEPIRLSYRLTWNAAGPAAKAVAKVQGTRSGAIDGGRRFVVDFVPDEGGAGALPEGAVPEVQASAGRIENIHATEDAETGTRRLVFDFKPEGAGVVELRALLKTSTAPLTETWLFRWTPD